MMGPKNDDLIGDYATLLSMIRHHDRTFIRHDVDHCMLKAIEMAMCEADHGYSATYFLLPTAPYFDYSAKFEHHIDTLLLLGHSIGLHNNALTEHIRDSKALTKAIREPLNFLRKHTKVKLTAAHGDKFLKQKKLINHQMWKESDEPWNGPTLSLKDYSLSEVYFGQPTYYLSDTGGRWRGGLGKHNAFEDSYEPCNPIDVIFFFNKTDDGMFHLLVHPYWWA